MTDSHFIAPEHQKMFDDLMNGAIGQVQEHGSEYVATTFEELSAVIKEKLAGMKITADGEASHDALLKIIDVLEAQAKHLRENPTPPSDPDTLPDIEITL